MKVWVVSEEDRGYGVSICGVYDSEEEAIKNCRSNEYIEESEITMTVSNFLIYTIILNVFGVYYYTFSILVLNKPSNDAVLFFSLIVLIISFFIMRINEKINRKLNI